MSNLNRAGTDRVMLIDALRGFALVGITMVHYNFWMVVSPMPDSITFHDFGTLSRVAELINSNFIKGKFYFLFSFIFGMSFFLQSVSYQKKTSNLDILFLRRATFLFVAGWLHNMMWAGDILGVYAVLMFPVILLRRLPVKALLVLSALFIADMPNLVWEIVKWVTHAVPPISQPADYSMLNLIQHGSIPDIISFNLNHIVDKFTFLALSGRLSITLGFMLLGVVAGQKGWARQLQVPLGRVMTVAVISLVLLGAFQALGSKLYHVSLSAKGLIFVLTVFLQNVSAMGLFLSLIIVISEVKFFKIFYESLATIGRMSLTVYLVQSAIGLLLFYHYGLNLYLRTTPAQNMALALFFIGTQVALCAFWLRYFRYGPIEYLLRAFTLLEIPDIRKKP